MVYKNYYAPGMKNKYRNRKCEADGYKFDSEKERKRYYELRLLEKAGEIHSLKVHPVYRFERHIGAGDWDTIRLDNGRLLKYIPDFSYCRTTGLDRPGGFVKNELIVEDVKSPMTRKLPAYRIKKALMRFWFGIEVKEI